MTAARGPLETWIRAPKLGDLYVLHIDGRPTASTSLVDHGLSRSEQIEALAQLAWPPPQQLTAIFDAINQASQFSYSHDTLPGDRKASPFRGGHGATIDGDEAPSTNPVGRYLFPAVEKAGELALDPGERVIATWKSFAPYVAGFRADGVEVRSATYVPPEIQHPICVLTNRRIACVGHLHFPPTARDDYPSIYLPPLLFESIAAFRQIKRWRNRPNLYWGIHVRHEWVSQVQVGNLPEKKRPLLKRDMDDTQFVTFGFRYRNGGRAVLKLPYKQSDPPLDAIGELCVGAVKSNQPQAVVSEPVRSTRQISTESLRRTTTESTVTREIEGTVVWSLPPEFAPLGLDGESHGVNSLGPVVDGLEVHRYVVDSESQSHIAARVSELNATSMAVELPFSCEQCKHSFASAEKLSSHIMNFH